ncbi:MAG: D-alanyl-D-alanine carboxypeptidase family protein [Acidimicrobiia bacterium]
MKRLRHVVVAFLAAALTATWLPAVSAAAPLVIPTPPREGGLVVPEGPRVSAESWLVYDADADLILGSNNADAERAMASTTKIMTALVALKYGNPDDLVSVSTTAADVGEAEIGLVAGERFPLRLLITALVARSANDAAMAVAEHVGGTVEGFVDMMNTEAAGLGLRHTHFENPHGLDAVGHYSSAADLLTMALAAMEYPEFREMTTTERATFPPAPDGTERVIESTNHLLDDYPGVFGVKTGFTGEALLVFVAAAERDGRTLFAVVMGSEGAGGHFADATSLLDWGYGHFRGVGIVAAGQPYDPPEPERVVEVVPETEPEPVVVERVRSSDGEPPGLAAALGWIGLVVERLSGG